jgi:hypothetical protein
VPDAELLWLWRVSEARPPRGYATCRTKCASWPTRSALTTYILSPWQYQSKVRLDQVHELITTRAQSLCCPFCEVYDLERYGHSSLRCASRDNFLTGTLLETLSHIVVDLLDAISSHACKCGHPEMKRLPDAGYWCLFLHRNGLRPPGRAGLHRGDPTRAASDTALINLTLAEMSSKKL